MTKRAKTALTITAIVTGCLLTVVWFADRTGLGFYRSMPRRTMPLTGTSLYINDAVCADCHEKQSAGVSKTGHSDTFRSTVGSKLAKSLGGKSFHDVERGYEFQYLFDERQGLSVKVPSKFGEDVFPLSFEFGSGHNAVTFLTLIPNRLGDTVGIEHRVSLYPGKAGWDMDLTPGHQGTQPQQDVEHFGLVIEGDKLRKCVSCHTTSAEIMRQHLANLRPNVGCQSCHGPGREHVIAVEQGQPGNYAGFTKQTAMAEIQLCGRCHRLPDADSETKVDPHNSRLVRFQSVGLLQAECFQLGGKNLKCSTCHDPHEPVSRDENRYVRVCLNCHSKPDSVHCPVSPDKSCIPCHMPKVDVHRGILFSDHWIRVRTAGDKKVGSSPDVAK